MNHKCNCATRYCNTDINLSSNINSDITKMESRIEIRIKKTCDSNKNVINDGLITTTIFTADDEIFVVMLVSVSFLSELLSLLF